MASARSGTFKMAVAVASIGVALLLLAMATPAMADVIRECFDETCHPACIEFSAGACKGIEKRLSLLNPMCRAQVESICLTLCYKLCSLDTLPSTPLPECFLP